MSLLEGLAQLAQSHGHGVYRRGAPYDVDEVAISLSGVIPTPDRLLVITAYQGGPEPDSKLPFDEPYIQWRIRDRADEAASRERARALYDDMHGRGVTVLSNGVLILSVIATNAGPIPLGRDDAGRFEHTVNTRIEFHNPTVLRPAP